MRILVDTGVLIRGFDRSLPEQRTIFRAFRKLWAQNHNLVTTPQNIAEFWNVLTRPTTARGGYGLAISEVESRVGHIERLGDIIHFSAAAYLEWRRLLLHHQIVGINVHDARLVATMQAEGIQHLLTMNAKDFRRYQGIVILTPESVLVP